MGARQAGRWVRLVAALIALRSGLQVATAQCPGDLDGNGTIDLKDFAEFDSCVLGPDVPNKLPSCAFADFDGDADTDLQDFAGFQQCFGSGVSACPEPSDTLYVDAVAGSDNTGTGAGDRPECAFKSITRATTTAGVGIAFKTIRARPGRYSAATTQEVFPIKLPSGVKLTTVSAPSPSAVYEIVGSGTPPGGFAPVGSVHAAVTYSGPGAATLENFTVLGTGATTDVVACRAGSLTLKDVTLENGERGAGLYGDCAALLTGITTASISHAGVEVASRRGVLVSGLRADHEGDGIHHHAGWLTIDGADLKSTFNTGLLVSPEDRGVTDAPLALNATGLSVHDCLGFGLAIEISEELPFGISAVSISSSSFFRNEETAIEVNAASTSPMFFGTLQIYENVKDGVEVAADSSVAFASVSVTGNGRAGVRARGDFVEPQ